jgi:hypothetical protein
MKVITDAAKDSNAKIKKAINILDKYAPYRIVLK